MLSNSPSFSCFLPSLFFLSYYMGALYISYQSPEGDVDSLSFPPPSLKSISLLFPYVSSPLSPLSSSPAPLDLEEPVEKSPTSSSSAASSIPRGRFSIKQQLSGLFKPQVQTGQTCPVSQGSASPNSNRRSNFYVEAPIKELRWVWPVA